MHGAIENRQCCQIMTECAAGQRGRNGDRYEYCSILRLSVGQPPFLYGRCKSTRQLDRPKRAYPCLRRLPHGTDGRDSGRGFSRRRQGHWRDSRCEADSGTAPSGADRVHRDKGYGGAQAENDRACGRLCGAAGRTGNAG